MIVLRLILNRIKIVGEVIVMRMKIIGQRYNLIKEIGLDDNREKSDSRIYIASDLREDNNTVVVKILELNPNVEKDIKEELFKREYISLSKLTHANIIKYMDSGTDGNNLYLVMEYYDGKTLKKYIEDNDLNIEKALKIAIKLSEVIAYAHEKGVIHRDLKPSNILIINEDDIRVIDFGISKILNYNYDSDSTLKCCMTTRYAAPEQLLKLEAKVQSDIYSFGLNVAYLLCGIEPPEEKDKIIDYISNIKCSYELKQILFNITHRDIKYRISSMYQVKREIEKEYNKVRAKTKKLYIKFNSYIQRKLEEIGAIDYSNKENTKVFLTNDLKTSYIYRNKKRKSYYLIGLDIKYECRMFGEQSGLEIIKVNCMDDQIEWEKEKNRGILIELPWIPIDNENDSNDEQSFFKILNQEIVNEENIKQNKKDKNAIRSQLLDKWNRYLNEEFSELDNKKKICNYKNYIIDESGYKIIIPIEELEFEIKQGELIQMTSKDNNQTTVGEYEGIVDKEIYIRLKNNINPLELSERGVLGIDIEQSRRNLKRLMKALMAIKYSDTANANLSNILADPSIVDMNNEYELESGEFFQDILKNSFKSANANAVRKALGTQDIFLIQGPPGTGKSTVITEIVCQILSDSPQAKILLTSQSHVAVDHVVSKISKLLSDTRIIRIGRNDRISEQSKNLMMAEQLNKWVTDVKSKSVNNVISYLKGKYNYFPQKEDFNTKIENNKLEDNEIISKQEKILKLTREWHRRLGKLDEFDEIFANKASIIAATCIGIASRNVINDMNFDWVIVDEAARATPLELLVPIVRGKKIILVGDHRQLPPVVKTEINKYKLEEKGVKESDLEKSLFEELFDDLDEINSNARLVLNTQYRMHPAISKIISDIFYPNVEIISEIKEEDRNHYLEWWPKCVKWIDTSKMKDNNELKELLSKKNNCEAHIILKTLEKIEDRYRKINKKDTTVSIISGYDAQKQLLVNLIKPTDKQRWMNINILIDNVDAFQGSETDIVIYSLVRSNNEYKIGFLYDERRLNVALSRGRSAVIIVGNIEFAQRAKSFMGNPFVDIIKFIKKDSKRCLIEVYNED